MPINITAEKFHSYEVVRKKGVTNMCNISTVSDLTDLTREEIMYIMQHYASLSEKYSKGGKVK